MFESNSRSLFRNISQLVFFQLYRLVDSGLSTRSLLFGYILNDITSWSDPVSMLLSIFYSLIYRLSWYVANAKSIIELPFLFWYRYVGILGIFISWRLLF